jgi:hypothetical protein
VHRAARFVVAREPANDTQREQSRAGQAANHVRSP